MESADNIDTWFAQCCRKLNIVFFSSSRMDNLPQHATCKEMKAIRQREEEEERVEAEDYFRELRRQAGYASDEEEDRVSTSNSESGSDTSWSSCCSQNDGNYDPNHHSYFMKKCEDQRRLFKKHPLVPPLEPLIASSNYENEVEAEQQDVQISEDDDM